MTIKQTNSFFKRLSLDDCVCSPSSCDFLLRDCFEIDGSTVCLALTEETLFFFEDPSSDFPSHSCPLTFQVKAEVIYSDELVVQASNPLGVILEKEGIQGKLQIKTNDVEIMKKWVISLERRVNQRNFHKLFRAKRKIGKGAFATVYLAERIRDGTLVAVKAFSKERQYANEKGKQSLENEVKLMRKVNHPNVMRLEGIYETENSIYVILEYLQGTQLNTLLKSNKRLRHQEIKTILGNLLQGLIHLNENGIIHRDLKPENIMFRNEDGFELAICDFGLATLAAQEKYLFVRCGTPGFVAPEIINIKDMQSKSQTISDMFSIGVIFHYLLLGHSVFEGKNYTEILNQNRQCNFDFSKSVYDSIDPLAFSLLQKMLEKDPRARISAKEALELDYFSTDNNLSMMEQELPTMALQTEKEEEQTIASKRQPKRSPRMSVLKKFVC